MNVGNSDQVYPNLEEVGAVPPPGWHIDHDSGAWMCDTIHHMGRRCQNWDYHGTGSYQITLVLNDRSQSLFGELVGPYACPGINAGGDAPYIELTEFGHRIEAHFRRIPEFTPEIEVLGVQMMPEHMHGVLRVTHRMSKPLGEHLRGFKIGATKIAREFGVLSRIDAREPRGRGLFADGFVDTILGDAKAVANGLAYIADNPRRLWEKRAHPELFRVLRDLQVPLPELFSGIDAGERQAHFAAIGNQSLLQSPHILQVQCSRRYFAYRRQSNGNLIKESPYATITREFEEKCECLFAAAAHGAVLVSPCISQGEKEIARRAFQAGHKVITLANKGFSPLYKPGGKLFDQCANGNLLMLAPIRWEYLPGEKKMTRLDACALNRIAQLLAGDGAVEIDYKGAQLGNIDHYVMAILKAD